MRLEEIVASIHVHLNRIRDARALAALTPGAEKPKHGISSELRARMAEAQRMRWRRRKAAKAAKAA